MMQKYKEKFNELFSKFDVMRLEKISRWDNEDVDKLVVLFSTNDCAILVPMRTLRRPLVEKTLQVNVINKAMDDWMTSIIAYLKSKYFRRLSIKLK